MIRKVSLGLATVLMTLSFGAHPAVAHPVKFKGATGVMGTVSPHQVENEVNYTFGRSTAVGVTQAHLGDGRDDRDYLVFTLNQRFRKNWTESQGNFYIGAGGGARLDEESPAGAFILQADWESRRFYTLAGTRSLFDGDGQPRASYLARAGVAPYLAPYGGLSTWLIAQGEYRPYRRNDDWMVGPVLRFYYQNYLVEVGSSLKGDLSFTYMVTF